MNSFDYAVTYAYVHTKSAMHRLAQRTRERVEEFKNDESGMEIIAVVLILIIVIALAVIFRKAIGNLFSSLWDAIKDALKGNDTDVDPGQADSMQGGF